MKDETIITDLTQEELEGLLMFGKQQTTTEVLEKLIKYLRIVQENYMEGDGEQSGVEHLMLMVSSGTLSLDKAIQILPAVEKYIAPYEIKFLSDGKK